MSSTDGSVTIERTSSGRHSRIRSEHWLEVEEGRAGFAGNVTQDATDATGVATASSGEPPTPNVSNQGSLVQNDAGENPADPNSYEQVSLSDRRKEFYIIVCIFCPAVLVTFILLGMFWDEGSGRGCWLRYWCLVEAFRLTVSMIMSWVLQRDVERSPERVRLLGKTGSVISSLSLVWFILGHAFIIQSWSDHDEYPTLFGLAAGLLILQYTIMCLPFIVLILMAPLLCICFPCILHGLIYLNKSPVKGATKREIKKLPTATFNARSFANKAYDNQCSICIMDFEEGETIRILPCRHVFHKDCVDSWLILNGTCPVCRAHIKPERSEVRKRSDTQELELQLRTSSSGSTHSEPPIILLPISSESQQHELEYSVPSVAVSEPQPIVNPTSPEMAWELDHTGDNMDGALGDRDVSDGAGSVNLSISSEEGEPSASERVAASSALWRRVFSFQSLLSRGRRVRTRSSTFTRRNSASLEDLVTTPAQMGIAAVVRARTVSSSLERAVSADPENNALPTPALPPRDPRTRP